MPKSAIQHTLKHWLDAAEHFEQGLISENIFLRAQAGAMETASHLKPTSTNEAVTMLMFAVLLWKEETGEPTTPTHIAMDKMLGSVVDFLQGDIIPEAK